MVRAKNHFQVVLSSLPLASRPETCSRWGRWQTILACDLTERLRQFRPSREAENRKISLRIGQSQSTRPRFGCLDRLCICPVAPRLFAASRLGVGRHNDARMWRESSANRREPFIKQVFFHASKRAESSAWNQSLADARKVTFFERWYLTRVYAQCIYVP